MPVDDVLQLRGIDVIAGGNDHPLDALLEIDKAVLVHQAQITGVEPKLAVGVAAQGLRRFFRVVQITQHHRGAAEADLALCSRSYFVGRAGGDNFVERVREGNTDGTLPGIIFRGQAGGGNTLGGAVALPDLLRAMVRPEEGVHLFLQLGGQTVTTAENTLEEAEVCVFQTFCPEQRFKQGGYTGDEIRLLLPENLGIDFDAELGHQNAACAAHQGSVDADTQTESVENGHD